MSIQTRTTALQNEIVRLYFTFEKNGRLANPASQPLVEIIDTDGVTILATTHAVMEHTGLWYADWAVPANLPLGDYYDRWTFQWDINSGVSEYVMVFTVHSYDSYINFISPAISHKISNRMAQLLNDLSNLFIYEAQHIPVYFEQAMRIQQDNQPKRVERYYYFTLDADKYYIEEGAVYFNNSQRFKVFHTLTPLNSSSSSSSESIDNISTSSSSSSSLDSSSSSSISSFSSLSFSSESIGNSSTSSSSVIGPTTTTTTTEWIYHPILTCVGTGNPTSFGTLSKVSGIGPSTINFISVEEETSRFSTVYSLAYRNWNMEPRPIVRVNGRLVDDGWTVDYNGKIWFDSLMAPEDSVNVAYNFGYFSLEELMSFLYMGLQMMNSVPPASIIYNSIDSMPIEWNAPVLIYAGIIALKRLIFGLNWQEKFVIFTSPDDPNAANTAIQNFKDLYTDYTNIWTEIKKDVKTRKLPVPGIMQVITPEYTLPGGRSRWFRYLYKNA